MADGGVSWIRSGQRGGKHTIYVDHVLEGLHELSDEDVQRERWSTGPASLSEAREQVFSDSGLSGVLDRAEGARLLTPTLAAAFETLSQALRDVEPNRPPDHILDDPGMTIVRTAAQRALILVQRQLSK